MRKLIFIMIIIIGLTGCEIGVKNNDEPEVVIDCDQGNTEENQMCESFKTVNLLAHDLVYDAALYGDALESIDWELVLYQYREYYDTLKPYLDQEVLSFDTTEMNVLEEDVYEVIVTYNDSYNQVIEKSLYVEYRDSSLITKENGEYVNIAIGSFTHVFETHTVTFDTHPERQYVFHTDIPGIYEMLLNVYVTREDEFMYYNFHGYDVEVFDLGYRVFFWDYLDGDEVEKEVYYVFHNHILLEKNYAITPIESEEGVTVFPVYGERVYQLYDFSIDTVTGFMHFTFDVSTDSETFLHEEVTLTSVDQGFDLSHPAIRYNIEVIRINERRLHVILWDTVENFVVHYVIEP